MILAEAADGGGAAKAGGHVKASALRLDPELRLNMLASMAMSANAEAHSVAAMGESRRTPSHRSPTLLLAPPRPHPVLPLRCCSLPPLHPCTPYPPSRPQASPR